MSEKIVEISKALSKFQDLVDPISKDANNPFFKNKYASLSTILKGIREPLRESNLVFTQVVEGNKLVTLLIHIESGEYFKSTADLIVSEAKSQAYGSAITYMRRYALSAILGLNVDSDDDGNESSNVSTKTVKAQTVTKQF